MAEWLYEEGIGECRAALVEKGRIAEAVIELPSALRARSVLPGRLAKILLPGQRAIVTTDWCEAVLEPVPPGLTEGQAVTIEIVREAIPEQGRPKLPKCRLSDAQIRPGPALLARMQASGVPVSKLGTHGEDRLEQAGWSEVLEEARTGHIAFDGGSLRMSLTPAMTLLDVDGSLPAPQLARAGAEAAGRAIRRLAIGGSIGIDLPTLAARDERKAAAAALDEVLPQPFERTAVNGFGFLQVVRKRERPSLPELLHGDPAGAAARALLRLAERTPGAGARSIRAAPPVIAAIQAQAEWMEALQARIGAPVQLQANAALAIWQGHVQSEFA